MERIDLTTLRLFCAVAEEANIARAAAREHIAASAISKRVQELEVELGIVLFVRHRQGADLTPAGDALYRHAKSVFSVLRRMTDEMQEYAAGLKGHVRVSANPSSIIQFLPAILKGFVSKYPDVNIQLSEEVSETSMRLVRDGVVDLGLITSMTPTPGLELVPFRSDRICLLVREDHVLAERDTIAFKETLVHDHVGLKDGSGIQTLVMNAAEAGQRVLNLKVRVASFDALRHLVQSEVGVGFLPESCIRPYEQSMGIKAVALTDAWANRDLSICIRSRDELSVTARAFLKALLA